MSIKDKEIYIIVQNIRSLYNVGAIFRCADVFGVSKIYICGYTGFPPRNQISKTALGAEEWIFWERKKQILPLLRKLKKQGVKIVALETGKKTKPLPKFKPKFPVALVVGNEIKGISRGVINLADEVVEIPMCGRKDSLNVAVAAGVALYRFRN
jgi:tRNA G18 (ribose-2'-O)-methylase SpoU